MKILNFILTIGMLLGDGYFIYDVTQTGDTSRLSTYIVTIGILLVPIFLKKVLKLNDYLIFVYLVFIFLAQFLGSVVNLYNMISWYDTFTHFLSGILTCFVALILLVKFKQDPTRKILFHVTYILGIVFLVASGWEFFEFTMDTLTGSNLQHAIETGVSDTMEDMLAAFGGSLIFLTIYLYEMLKSKQGFITKFIHNI